MFSQEINAFKSLVEKRLKRTVTAAVSDLATSIIKKTPIDLPFGWHDPESVGLARGGWFVSFNGPSSQISGRLDPSGETTAKNIKNSLNFYQLKIHDSLYINNNVPYISILESGGYENFVNRIKSTPAGFSSQAPAGMARLSAFLWPTFISNAVVTSRRIS